MPVQRRPGQPRRNSSGLGRDLEILDLLSSSEALQSGGLGVVRVAELTGRDKAVISRALATLASAGLVTRHPGTLAYRLGPKLFALAAQTIEAALVAEARPYLRAITRHTGETTHLCVLREGNVLTLISELSPHEVRTRGWQGITTAAWRTPSGWVLLSDWAEQELASWYAEHGHDLAVLNDPVTTPGRSSPFAIADTGQARRVQVRDLPSLLTATARIRQQGYAISDEDLELGVVAVSAPVTGFTGSVIAALNVSAPKARTGSHLDTLGRYVASAAKAISQHLGGMAAEITSPRQHRS